MKGPAPLLVVAFATVALAGCASVTAPDEGAFCSATADARPPDLSVAALAHHPGTALASATVRASCPAPTNAINLLSAILQKLASGGPQEVGPYPVEDFHTPREKEQFVDEIETLLGVFQNSDAAAYCAAITSLQDRLDLFLKPNSRGLVNMERDLAHVKSQAGCG